MRLKPEDKRDLALILCPNWGVNVPPIGLAYLATNLKRRGIIPKVLDLNIEVYRRVTDKEKKLWNFENNKYWCDWDNEFKKLMEEQIEYCVKSILSYKQINIYAFSVSATNRLFTIEVIKRIKKKYPQKIIIVGGVGDYDKREREEVFPLDTIDYFIIGEGEESLTTLIKKIRNRELPSNITGVISYKHNIFTPPKPIEDLDTLFFPTYEEFDLHKYTERSLAILSSRGCKGRCAFCNDWKITMKYRNRSAESVFKEIEHHIKKYNIKDFYFNDLAINWNPKELEKLCDLIIKSDYKISWIALASANNNLSYNLLKKMKLAGCKTLDYGIESGSERVLKLMRKPITLEAAEKSLSLTRAAGINTQLNFIVGFPGETREDVEKTIDFIRRNRKNIAGITNINRCNVVAGSDLEINARKYGIIFPKDKRLRDSHWYTKEGNNYEERKRRAEQVIKVIKELNLPIFTSNVNEKESDIKELIKEEANEEIKNKKESKEKKKMISSIRFKLKDKINKILRFRREQKLNVKKKSDIILDTRNPEVIDKIRWVLGQKPPRPKYVTIDLTNRCNLRCIACWTYSPLLKDKEASPEWKAQTLPFESVKRLINDLRDLGTERIRLTGGGEPFLYPKIMKVIKLIKEEGMACDITTNGTLLTKERIKELFTLKVDEIVISLWAGDAETYVKTHPTQTEKTFFRIKELLKFVAQYKEKTGKGPKVIMANVISKVNYNKITEMAKFATEVSLDELYFTMVDPIKGRTDVLLLNENERNILLQNLKKSLKIINNYNMKSKIHKIRIDDITRFVNKIKSKGADKGEYDLQVLHKPCYIGYIFARILANGDVVPCCRAVMYPMGNINKKSFKEIWFSEEYNHFRERALYESKLSPYFKKIGCYTSCDNQVQNREMEEFLRRRIK